MNGCNLAHGRRSKANPIDPTCQKSSSLEPKVDQPSFTSTQSSGPRTPKLDSPVKDDLSDSGESEFEQDEYGSDAMDICDEEEYLASLSKLDDDIDTDSLVIQDTPESRDQHGGRARKTGWIEVLRKIDEKITTRIHCESYSSVLNEQHKLFEESRTRRRICEQRHWLSAFPRSTDAEASETESQAFEALLEDFGGHQMMEII
ncbi:hypothetical protein Slin15195_G127640 [Septoria linicola]|uniref:Uncharacterized protein n=1 Tax=Septoria linicola TaxID=215465 RepID=A0A9Q9EQT1_9PEZI|nr:hypothetical protein Slin15195_G127640 [Septoria linicola]